jgi:hypothetical protein
LDRRLGAPESPSGRCGEEKNLAQPGIEPDRILSNSLFINHPIIRHGVVELLTAVRNSPQKKNALKSQTGLDKAAVLMFIITQMSSYSVQTMINCCCVIDYSLTMLY